MILQCQRGKARGSAVSRQGTTPAACTWCRGKPGAWDCTHAGSEAVGPKAPEPTLQLQSVSKGLKALFHSIHSTAHSVMAPVSGKLQAPKVPSQEKKLGFKTQATMDFPICLSCLTMLNPTAQVSRTGPSATTVLRIVVSSPVMPMPPQGCTGQTKAEVLFLKNSLRSLNCWLGSHICACECFWKLL